MANVADLNLIQINNFPEVTNPSEWIVVSDAAGIGYKISKENFKAFLGTVQVTSPKPLSPSDPAPGLDGIYLPMVDGEYLNAEGIIVDRSEGGADYGMSVKLIKNGTTWTKVAEPLPEVDTSSLISKTEIVDDLTTGGRKEPLSAEQGVVLDSRISSISTRTETIESIGETTTGEAEIYARSTFSGFASKVPSKKDFNAIKIRVRSWDADNPVTKLRVVIRLGDDTGAIVADKTINDIVFPDTETKLDILFEFDAIVQNPLNQELYIIYLSDGHISFEAQNTVSDNLGKFTTSKDINNTELISLSNPNFLMYVEYFTIVRSETPDPSFVSKIFDSLPAITPEKTNFIKKVIVTGKNLFNKNSIPPENIGHYPNWTTGELSPNASYNASDFISIKPNTNYAISSLSENNLLTAPYYAVYDMDKVFLRGARDLATWNSGTNAAYVILGVRVGAYMEEAQLEEGIVSTPYVPYTEPVEKLEIENLLLPEFPPAPEPETDKQVDILLPSQIFLTEGLQQNIYFENVVIPEYGDRLENYPIQVTCAKGRTYEEYYRLTPSAGDAGNTNLSISVKRGRDTLKTTTTVMRIAAKNAATGITRKVLFIGDSTIDGNDVTNPLKANFDTDVMNVEFVGTRGAAGMKHEGFSGWTINDFATAGRVLFRFNVNSIPTTPSINDTFTNNGSTFKVVEINLTAGTGYFSTERTAGTNNPILTASTLVGSYNITYDTAVVESANPFWNTATSKFDFAMYLANTGQTMSANDWVMFQLGINDMFGQTALESAQAKTITMLAQLMTIIENIQSVVPGIRIGVAMTIPPAASQDAFAASYANSYYRELYFKTGWLTWNKKLLTDFDTVANKDLKRYLIPIHLNLDTVYNFSSELQDANSRNTTDKRKVQNNAVHPDGKGNAQIADSYTGAIKYFE